jgi:prophage tail gpP-like protein
MGSPVSTLTFDDVNVTAPSPTVKSTATEPAPATPPSPGVGDQLTIRTGGKTLEGWLTSSVIRDIDAGPPSRFTISLTERFPNSDNSAVIVPGSACQVYLGSNIIITGYIDNYLPTYDARTHRVVIEGRSNTEDVVDSSYVGPPWGFSSGASLKTTIAAILSQQTPNVGLSFLAPDQPLPTGPAQAYQVTFGESVYSVIESLCRMCQLLLYDDENGNLVINTVGTTRAGSSLVEGQNVEAAAVRVDWSQRFHNLYIGAAGQIPGAAIANSIFGSAQVDQQIRTSRSKIVLMDHYPSPALVQQRANWEMNRRIGRSLMTQVTVTGWRDGAGNLWKVNTVVGVQLPTLKINSDLIIAACEYDRDENGTRTVLTCMPGSALKPAPYIPVPAIGQNLMQGDNQ